MHATSRDSSSHFAQSAARRALLALALLHSAAGYAVSPPDAGEWFVSPVDSFLAAAAADAIAAAERLLADPRCEQIFTDFRNPSGSPLQAALDALGVTGGVYLHRLRFVNGEHLSPCSSGALAATRPGSRVIYLCGSRFAVTERNNPRLGASLLLHEELHSLGLSENPPTSREITARVLARCAGSRRGISPRTPADSAAESGGGATPVP